MADEIDPLREQFLDAAQALLEAERKDDASVVSAAEVRKLANGLELVAEASVEETAKAETAKEEAAKAEVPKEKAAKEETAKEETAKEETAKEETAKEETAKEETAKEETAKEETPAPVGLDPAVSSDDPPCP